MGSINKMFEPKKWQIILKGNNIKNHNDIVYRMIVGTGEDYYNYFITEFISKINYEKILTGEYHVKMFPYSEKTILLFDENNKVIPLVRYTNIDINDLTREQKETIKVHSLVKKIK